MKQILQNLSNGETVLEDVPCPVPGANSVLIQSSRSLLSLGTERMLVDFGKSNYISKALKKPEKALKVIEKIRSEGLLQTVDAVKSKLDQPLALGYCNAGVVIQSNVDEFKVGDRVASNGFHAEYVVVPENLCAKIPIEVDDETASFTVLSSIGLQAIRLINPTIGETVVVMGLGLIGLLTVQMLKANGCNVIGIDFDSKRCEIAENYSAKVVKLSENQDPVEFVMSYTNGIGADAVIIAASTKSDLVISQSAQICRKLGRIVLLGVVGLKINREDFYKKEIKFQVSSSYGPGRYDKNYENNSNDYPIGYVRWTAQRNFQAVLDLMKKDLLCPKPLITNRYSIDDAIEAYKQINNSSALAILLNYENERINHSPVRKVKLEKHDKINNNNEPIVGFIGAGNYGSRILIPAFKNAGVKLHNIVSNNGLSGVFHGNKHGFLNASTDKLDVLDDKSINTVVIVTRHDSHAELVIDSLRARKNIFVEKPLALTLSDLEKINTEYSNVNYLKIMVGFNRRFAPHIVKMKELLKNKAEPKAVVITVSAGHIPKDHWTQDLEIGGGRIIGEACHFIDLARFLVSSSVNLHKSVMIGDAPGIEVRNDKVIINLTYNDGSIATIIYLANGGNLYPKERVEVFCGNSVLQLDNYLKLKAYNYKNFNKMKLFKQNKGQKECVQKFIESIKYGRPTPIPYNEIVESTKVSIEIEESLN